MGNLRQIPLVKLFCGIIAVDEDAVALAKQGLKEQVGEIDLQSDMIPFDFTDYYRAEMGEGLLRQFVSFEELIPPDRIADIKLLTNEIEKSNSFNADGQSRRRINLDPGYVTPAKIVLATTKDFSHRIYLRDGIYAEVTMGFRKEGFKHFDWTYPDFKSGRYDDFFKTIREGIMSHR